MTMDHKQAAAKAREILVAADADGNGWLSKNELKKLVHKDAGLQKLLHYGENFHWKTFWNELDADHDGRIVFDELERYIEGLHQPDGGKPQPAGRGPNGTKSSNKNMTKQDAAKEPPAAKKPKTQEGTATVAPQNGNGNTAKVSYAKVAARHPTPPTQRKEKPAQAAKSATKPRRTRASGSTQMIRFAVTRERAPITETKGPVRVSDSHFALTVVAVTATMLFCRHFYKV
ncbi:hypothetical protein PTSG_10812 [Salpingoeca rosetta]|uniref:EF-hand domain-containing protein n=1 Tax=Salpingoeca rosetta (strain ATCC 50818 / BSB-021) TaxID=946362 RepID=F2UPZ9_SALR5|nr:uncharacterized protein PTSG_10812 [Salpingoeca rosetta]EGD79829.1 hypothetical protein PTSG_10812 [Salpingoeca rosetta]|eukprot:XP_004988777.1 hypothetical protein PTSG_10812 [Salpingoeca rosetta]